MLAAGKGIIIFDAHVLIMIMMAAGMIIFIIISIIIMIIIMPLWWQLGRAGSCKGRAG